jgi:hypothetical protein
MADELAPPEKWQREIERHPQDQRHESHERARDEKQAERQLHCPGDENELGVANTFEADGGKKIQRIALEKVHAHWDVPELFREREHDNADARQHPQHRDGVGHQSLDGTVKALERHVERRRPASHHEHEEGHAEEERVLEQQQRARPDRADKPNEPKKRRTDPRCRAVEKAERDDDLRERDQPTKKVVRQPEVRDEELQLDARHQQRHGGVKANDERHPGEQPLIVLPIHAELQRSRDNLPTSPSAPCEYRDGRRRERDRQGHRGPRREEVREIDWMLA